jgi:hypothetical protein
VETRLGRFEETIKNNIQTLQEETNEVLASLKKALDEQHQRQSHPQHPVQ